LQRSSFKFQVLTWRIHDTARLAIADAIISATIAATIAATVALTGRYNLQRPVGGLA